MESRPPRTCALGGSEGRCRHPPSHPNSWEWRAMLLPLSTNSRMMRVRAMAPASTTWHLATVHPGSALWQTLWDSRRSLRSLRKLTPLRTHVRGPSCLCKGTPRNYDNGGTASRHLHRQARCSTLRPMLITRWVTPGVTPARSNTTSLTRGTTSHSSLELARISLLQQCFCAAFLSS